MDKSWVWKYFQKIENECVKFEHEGYGRILSIKTKTTSNLASHLNSQHRLFRPLEKMGKPALILLQSRSSTS